MGAKLQKTFSKLNWFVCSQAAEANFRLLHLSKEKPNVVRLAVVGDEAAGKSQFIATVTSFAITTFVRSLRAPPAKGSDNYLAQRTPGVKLVDIDLPDGRVLRVLDLGGQPQFIGSHRPIVVTGHGMFLVVLNLLLGKEGLLKSGRYWIRFILATRDPVMFQDCQPPPLFVLFSHPDRLSGQNPKKLADEVFVLLKDEFDEYFVWFLGNPYIANCRIRSSEIRRLLTSFAEGHSMVSQVSYPSDV